MVCDIWYDGVSRLTQIFNCGEKGTVELSKSISDWTIRQWMYNGVWEILSAGVRYELGVSWAQLRLG